MKREKLSRSNDDVTAWKQAAQWLIDNGHGNNQSVQALALGVDNDEWGNHCLEVRDNMVITIGGHPHRLFEAVDGIWIQPVLPDQLYIVQLATPPYTVQEGLPTPFMIQQGEGEGYHVPPDSKGGKGVWRFRDDSYDPPGTKYTKVRVFRNPNQ